MTAEEIIKKIPDLQLEIKPDLSDPICSVTYDFVDGEYKVYNYYTGETTVENEYYQHKNMIYTSTRNVCWVVLIQESH